MQSIPGKPKVGACHFIAPAMIRCKCSTTRIGTVRERESMRTGIGVPKVDSCRYIELYPFDRSMTEAFSRKLHFPQCVIIYMFPGLSSAHVALKGVISGIGRIALKGV